MSKLTLRQSILSAKNPTTVIDNVFGGLTVHAMALTLRRRNLYLDAVYANEKANNAWKLDQERPEEKREGIPRVDLYDPSILLLMHGACDAEGELVFSLDDYDALSDADYGDITRVYKAIYELQNRDPEALKKVQNKP